MEKILVTGSSGFIGMHLCQSLLKDGFDICGIDNMNDYYDVSLKTSRLKELNKYNNFKFEQIDISNLYQINKVFIEFKPEIVINLAAQAGVRYSLENPLLYIKSNIVGFTNVIDCCVRYGVQKFIYASSSSVYGKNKKTPFSWDDNVERPISLYAATKKSNELIAHSYNHLYNLNTVGLRLFTVYGPWGRPDMAIYIFANKISKGEEIFVFNNGDMERDFTYIDDVINGIISSLKSHNGYQIFNLGNNRCEKLMDMIACIERELGKKAKIQFKDIQPGDVKKTYADIEHSKNHLNYNPETTIEEGIPKFIKWYKSYHKIV